jgi:hypothetical protein
MSSMSSNFGEAMHRLHTAPGVAREELDEIKAGIMRLAGAQAAALVGASTAAAGLAQEMARRREEDARQRRWFFADARDQGVSKEDAEKILAVAFSDDVLYDRSFAGPWDFAHAALKIVEARGAR